MQSDTCLSIFRQQTHGVKRRSAAPSVRFSCLALLTVLWGWTLAKAEPEGILRSARAVRELDIDTAARGLPVELTGVVVGPPEPDGGAVSFVIIDSTDPIFIRG